MPVIDGDDLSPQFEVTGRSEELLLAHQDAIYRRTDRLFASLMLFQWAAGIAAALWISPQTWIGAQSQTHLHVWAAILLGGAITGFPVFLARTRPGWVGTRHVIAVGQMLTSALLIHLTGGRIETHFHVFGSLAFLAFYRDWRVLVTATVVVAADHFARGVFFPQSVFGVLTASSWRWAEHAGWVLFEDIFLIISIRHGVREMAGIATRRATLEGVNTRIENEVAARTAELRVLFDLLPARIWFKDTKNGIIRVNQRVADAVGKAVEEIEGRPTSEIFPDRADAFYANDLEVIRSKQPLLGRVEEFPGKDGRPSWVQTSKVPYCDEHGEVIGIVVLAEDISERIRAEESLRLLSAAVEQSKESILITDAQLDLPGPGILFVNQAFTEMTGYTAAEVIGKAPRILQGPRTDRAVMQRLRENLTRGEVFDGETVNYRKDGTEFHLEWQVTPLRNGGGIITHHVALQRDITKRKAAEIALEEAHRQLEDASRQAGMAEVATSVLHNVGNVLNSVNISATVATDTIRRSCGADVSRIAALLQENRDDLPKFLTSAQGAKLPDFLTSLGQHLGDEQRKALTELQSLGTHIDHIKEIVEMQQTYARRAGLSEQLSAESLVEDALRLNATAFDRHGVRIVRDFAETPLLEVDKHKALQILTNLIRNAKEAMDDPGAAGKQMTVRISREGAALVQISVSDQGVGIPAENLTRIFAHGFTTRKNGHGFGLHSAALAAREMGGSLTAQSAGPGQGSTFTLQLPFTVRPTE